MLATMNSEHYDKQRHGVRHEDREGNRRAPFNAGLRSLRDCLARHSASRRETSDGSVTSIVLVLIRAGLTTLLQVFKLF